MVNWIAPEGTIPGSLVDSFTKAVACQQFESPAIFPYIRGKNLVMASDYSGDVKDSPFQILAFLLADADSVFGQFNPARLSIRDTYLPDGRRLSFKDLNDERRQKAIVPFLTAADELNGIVLCAAVDKRLELGIDGFPESEIKHKPAVWQKVLRISMFGATLLAGLSDATQAVHWVMDDDDIIANDELRESAFRTAMGLILHSCPQRNSQNRAVKFGIASQFDDDGLAEDLVSVADVAAGMQAEKLAILGPDRIPRETSITVPILKRSSTKADLINVWMGNRSSKLKKLVAIARPHDAGILLLSIGQPAVQHDRPASLSPIWTPPDKGWRNSSRFWQTRE